MADLTGEPLLSHPHSRAVVVAPHPDDEVLALGGTLAGLAQRGHAICIYAVTDGEGSHPQSHCWSPRRLRAARPLETALALRRLGITGSVRRLGLPDGGVAGHEQQLAQQLVLRPEDTVFVTWRHDGHADHEACARAALDAAAAAGARCIEFPVWALVPGHPAQARLGEHRLRRLALPRALRLAKFHAIAAFQSQWQADGPRPPVLPEIALRSWRRDAEWVLA